ncbi:MAG: hypothetical protein AAGD12_01605 [Pseudomonadota bacterium]
MPTRFAPVLHIHAGLPKTGTSAIQKVLRDNRGALLAQGILVPRTGQREDGPHHTLLAALAGVTAPGRRLALQRLRDEIAAARPHAVLISSELFIPLLRSLLLGPALRALSRDGMRLRLHLCLRPQADLLNSAYPQLLQSTLLPLPFSRMLTLRRRLGDFERSVARLERVAPVALHAYTPARSDSAPWHPLLLAAGLDSASLAALSQPGEVNPSLGPRATLFHLETAQRLARTAPPRRLSQRLAARAALLALSAGVEPEPTPFIGLDAAGAERLWTEFAAGNARLAARFWELSWDATFAVEKEQIWRPNACARADLSAGDAAFLTESVAHAAGLAAAAARAAPAAKRMQRRLADTAADWALRRVLRV